MKHVSIEHYVPTDQRLHDFWTEQSNFQFLSAFYSDVSQIFGSVLELPCCQSGKSSMVRDGDGSYVTPYWHDNKGPTER
jgi:hypothetical protein